MTKVVCSGTVHGAMESGWRAADEIAAAIGKAASSR